MRSVRLVAVVAGMSPEQVYERISRLEDYPRHTPTVRSVEVAESARDGSRSKWEINFRDGIMRWEEEDRFLPEEQRIRFDATSGDIDVFSGTWTVEGAAEGARVTFESDFDLGLSTLNEMVEPIADEALRETIEHILDGLTAGRSRVVEGAAASSAAARG